MLSSVPNYVAILFALTTLLTLFLLWYTVYKSKTHGKYSGWMLLFFAAYLTFQAILGFNGFYSAHPEVNPPRLPLTFAPLMLMIVVLFATKGGRKFIDSLAPEHVALISVVRIPVEICLYLLFTYKAIPELMTFEGINFDIVAGIGAPVIAWFGWRKGKLGKIVLWGWNIISLGLLINIVTNAILAAPFSFQQQAFDQPNIAVMYFPYVWLPAFIVPVVFFSLFSNFRHLAIRNRS